MVAGDTCHTLVDTAPQITTRFLNAALPFPQGGTIVTGQYHLKDFIYYGGGASGLAGGQLSETIWLTADRLFSAVTGSDYSEGFASWNYSASGSQFYWNSTCPALHNDNPGFSSTSTGFTLIHRDVNPNTGYAEVFEKVPAGGTVRPLGDRCQHAISISAGTLAAQSTAGFADDYNPGFGSQHCTGFGGPGNEPGNDRVYSISVPPGKTLTATVTTTGNNDAAIYLLASAAACTPIPTNCLDGQDQLIAGAETVNHTNTGSTPATVMIVIDSFNPGAITFDLLTSIH